jgi:hypothetical protein
LGSSASAGSIYVFAFTRWRTQQPVAKMVLVSECHKAQKSAQNQQDMADYE